MTTANVIESILSNNARSYSIFGCFLYDQAFAFFFTGHSIFSTDNYLKSIVKRTAATTTKQTKWKPFYLQVYRAGVNERLDITSYFCTALADVGICNQFPAVMRCIFFGESGYSWCCSSETVMNSRTKICALKQVKIFIC